MIRHIISESNFRNGLKKYLDTYQYKNVSTEDFRKVLEEVSGINLEHFFNQWIYTKGHPELDIVFDNNAKSIKIVQKQNDVLFDFEIEIKIALSDGSVKTQLQIFIQARI
jgi:aminopeptidase N